VSCCKGHYVTVRNSAGFRLIPPPILGCFAVVLFLLSCSETPAPDLVKPFDSALPPIVGQYSGLWTYPPQRRQKGPGWLRSTSQRLMGSLEDISELTA
jgi:hypothetical protein